MACAWAELPIRQQACHVTDRRDLMVTNGKARRTGERVNAEAAIVARPEIIQGLNSRTAQQPTAAESLVLALSPADQKHLAEYEKKLQMIRDWTTAIARGYATIFF